MTNKLRYLISEGFILITYFDNKKVMFRSVNMPLLDVQREYDKSPLTLSEVHRYGIPVQDANHARNLLDNWYDDITDTINGTSSDHVYLINSLTKPRKPRKDSE